MQSLDVTWFEAAGILLGATMSLISIRALVLSVLAKRKLVRHIAASLRAGQGNPDPQTVLPDALAQLSRKERSAVLKGFKQPSDAGRRLYRSEILTLAARRAGLDPLSREPLEAGAPKANVGEGSSKMATPKNRD
jgi:hypothetical protein